MGALAISARADTKGFFSGTSRAESILYCGLSGPRLSLPQARWLLLLLPSPLPGAAHG